MSIATVRARLASLQESITGINKAYVQLPKGILNSVDMPLFMNFVRNSNNDDTILGSGTARITRTYLMWLMVKPVAEGEQGEGESLVEPFIQNVSQFFISRPTLGNLLGVEYAHLVSDSGPKKMVWPGTPSNPVGIFWGVEFRLDVVEVQHVDYVDYL